MLPFWTAGRQQLDAVSEKKHTRQGHSNHDLDTMASLGIGQKGIRDGLAASTTSSVGVFFLTGRGFWPRFVQRGSLGTQLVTC